MESFTSFAETPCMTLEKLRAKGITQDSNYMQSLEASCNQKMQPEKVPNSKKNIIKIVGISAAIIGLITTLILINKKK